jgi:hypothetical protein
VARFPDGKPVCKKCELKHWPFVRCELAEARNEVEERNARERQSPPILRRPRPGERVFGDQMSAHVRTGENVFRRADQLGDLVQVSPGVFRRRRD